MDSSAAIDYDGLDVVHRSNYYVKRTEAKFLEYLNPLLTCDARVTSLDQYKIYNKIIFFIINTPSDAIRFGYDHLVKILDTVKEIFKSENTLIECAPDIHIIGDLNGHVGGLCSLISFFHHEVGYSYTPAHIKHSFLFLGNYVKDPNHSLEVIILLFSMKIASQFKRNKVRIAYYYDKQCTYHFQNFIMLRGNHESREINYGNGFRDELLNKFNKDQANDLFERFNDVFNHMPLSCLIGNRHLCMHGGISPKLTSFDAIRRIPKPLERVGKNELARDLLWADFKEGCKGFEPNGDRDISVRFGEDVLEKMVEKLGVEYIFRSHQKVSEGVRNDGIDNELVTITSYYGTKDNLIGLVYVNADGVCNQGTLRHPDIAVEEQAQNESKPAGGDFVIEFGDF